MYIYNRWGELVYQSEAAHTDAGWDGNFGGLPAPAGVYTYMVQLVDLNGRTIERRGTVFLMR